MMSRRFLLVRGGLVAVSVVAVLTAALALNGAEREWPAIRDWDFNLAFGPIYAEGSLAQTLRAPPTPLAAIAIYAVGSIPDRVHLRVFDRGDPSAPRLVAEAQAPGDREGRIRFDIPHPVDTSDRLLEIEIINPPGSRVPLTLQANHGDPYAHGYASAHGDPGGGRVDLRLQAWRRVSPMILVREIIRANVLGAAFTLITAATAAGLVLAWVRRLVAHRPIHMAVPVNLLVLAAGIALARVGFEHLAPWVV